MTEEEQLKIQQQHAKQGKFGNPVSDCCGYAITENTDLCGRCWEHCEVEILEDE